IPVPRIIDDITFARAQKQMQANSQHSALQRRQYEYLLINGRLRCGQCGCAMSGQWLPGHSARYRCGRGKRTYQDLAAVHTVRSVLVSEIDPLVWETVERLLRNPDEIAAVLEHLRDNTTASEGELDHERQHYVRQLA